MANERELYVPNPSLSVTQESDEDIEIVLPHEFTPRGYQRPVWEAMFADPPVKRAVLVWHRRAGKDLTALHITVAKAFERVGVYFMVYPTYSQGKKILWDGITSEGKPFMDAIPQALRVNTNATEMKVRLVNGSLIQLVGVDSADSIVGTNPVGVVFSEYSLMAPTAWDLIRPILAENKGWAMFIYTPRGRSHGYTLFEAARRQGWFTQLLTVDETKRDDGSPVVSAEAVEDERASGMDESLVLQEFYCSFDAAISGAYYASQLRVAYDQERICRLPIDPALDVDTYWDLGIGDSTAIVFVQVLANEVRIIDYYENSGEGLTHYVQYLKDWREKHDVRFGLHWAPHDIEVRELTTGKSRKEAARAMGIKFYTAPKLPIDEGIDMTRRLWPRCWFDADRCDKLLIALAEYRKEWDDRTMTFRDRPLHNWASHAADAFRLLGVALRKARRTVEEEGAPIADTNFDVWGR